MAELHQHPDGLIYVRTDVGEYCDTDANFLKDNGLALPALPVGAEERIYTQGKRHAIMAKGNVIAGGPLSWDIGDQIIAKVMTLKQRQEDRKIKEAPVPVVMTIEERLDALGIPVADLKKVLGL